MPQQALTIRGAVNAPDKRFAVAPDGRFINRDKNLLLDGAVGLLGVHGIDHAPDPRAEYVVREDRFNLRCVVADGYGVKRYTKAIPPKIELPGPSVLERFLRFWFVAGTRAILRYSSSASEFSSFLRLSDDGSFQALLKDGVERVPAGERLVTQELSGTDWSVAASGGRVTLVEKGSLRKVSFHYKARKRAWYRECDLHPVKSDEEVLSGVRLYRGKIHFEGHEQYSVSVGRTFTVYVKTFSSGVTGSERSPIVTVSRRASTEYAKHFGGWYRVEPLPLNFVVRSVFTDDRQHEQRVCENLITVFRDGACQAGGTQWLAGSKIDAQFDHLTFTRERGDSWAYLSDGLNSFALYYSPATSWMVGAGTYAKLASPESLREQIFTRPLIGPFWWVIASPLRLFNRTQVGERVGGGLSRVVDSLFLALHFGVAALSLIAGLWVLLFLLWTLLI
ncbi:hypothetical protein OAS39_07960 [Pirellulales bacterium]|nr:hypothetical protein [Pirellulales bacterium]